MTPRGGAKANVGDIAYYTNGKVNVVSPDAWDASLGTAVGVVVIPSGFAPDNGLARIVSLYWPGFEGENQTNENNPGGSTDSNFGLPSYVNVPVTNNTDLTSVGYGDYGNLPSDVFTTGSISYVDPVAAYNRNQNMIPSPYLGDTPNPAYYAEISGGNALSDFNGKGNTDKMYASGWSFAPYNAKQYKVAGAEEIEWYLPAIGELGYLMVRFNKIQTALSKMNVPLLNSTGEYWSSTKENIYQQFALYAKYGQVRDTGRTDRKLVRAFAQLDF